MIYTFVFMPGRWSHNEARKTLSMHLLRTANRKGPGVFAFLFALTLVAASCNLRGEVPALERRATELNKAIMCPICPGESIDQAQNTLALQMRGIVRDKLADGETEEQIKQFFVERYGPSVLLEPPRRGFNLTAWVVPPLVAAAGAGLFFLALRIMKRPAPDTYGIDAARESVSDDGLERYYARIEAVIGEGLPTRTPIGEERDDEGGG